MKVMKELQQDMEPYNFRVNDLNTPNDNQQSNTILFWSIVIFLKIVCVGLVILAVIITKDKHNENRVQMIGSKDAATMKRLIHSRPKMLSLEDDNKVFNSTILSSFFKQTMIYSINPPTAVTAQTTPYKKTSALMSIKDHSNDVKSAKFKAWHLRINTLEIKKLNERDDANLNQKIGKTTRDLNIGTLEEEKNDQREEVMQTEVDMETHQEYSKNTECERHQREDDQLLKDQNVRAGTNQSNLNQVMSTTSKGFNVDIVKMLENMTKIRREPENNHQEGNKLLYAYAAAVISVIVCILIYVVLITENYRVNIDINKVTMGSEDHVSNWNLNIIPRSKWQSKQPLNRANKINYPVHYVIIHHTATSNCSSHDECKLVTQSIQTFHIQSKHWRDIGYNFLVGGDGFVYEGRGWGVEGTHTYRYNAKSIGIAFIGIFDTTRPPERQIVAAQKLIQNGVELGYIVNDYILFAKLQESKRCSGLALLHLIKTWKNWNEKLSDCNIK